MYTYRVLLNERLTESTIRLTLEFEPKNRRAFEFLPGQYAAISFMKDGRPSVARCFSIVSSPTEGGQLQFSMRTRGRFTSALAKVKVGDAVRVRGPYGGFVFDPERHGDSVFVAGGIGITPFMSMLKYAADTHSQRRISLIYGVQSQDDIPFHAELDALVGMNPNLDVTYVVGNGPLDAIQVGRAVSGRVSLDVLPAELDDKTIFICGPPPFMNAMVHSLAGQGVSRHRIITEAFNQGSLRQTGKVASWPQNIYVLGALGVGFGALAIMVSEIVKSLPHIPLTSEKALNAPLKSSGQREKDLDALVNGLKEDLGRPNSPAVDEAFAATQPVGSSSASASQFQAAVVAAPVPVAQPKCTTTQSGVTTCV